MRCGQKILLYTTFIPFLKQMLEPRAKNQDKCLAALGIERKASR